MENIKTNLLNDLNEYFYNNQYKYSYYRDCDCNIEFDFLGNKYKYYVFYV